MRHRSREAGDESAATRPMGVVVDSSIFIAPQHESRLQAAEIDGERFNSRARTAKGCMARGPTPCAVCDKWTPAIHPPPLRPQLRQ